MFYCPVFFCLLSVVFYAINELNIPCRSHVCVRVCVCDIVGFVSYLLIVSNLYALWPEELYHTITVSARMKWMNAGFAIFFPFFFVFLSPLLVALFFLLYRTNSCFCLIWILSLFFYGFDKIIITIINSTFFGNIWWSSSSSSSCIEYISKFFFVDINENLLIYFWDQNFFFSGCC